MNTVAIYDALMEMKSRTWLHSFSFECSREILEKSVREFRADYLRWFPDAVPFERDFRATPPLIGILCYRISHNINLLYGSTREADAFSLLGREIGQIEIYYSATIGEAFKINHGIGTVIGARCRIGDNCTIHQNCTIGDRNGGRPTIGNNVTIYAGAMILGDITIGDDCIIGANSVVTQSYPAGSVIGGTPAKIIKKRYETQTDFNGH